MENKKWFDWSKSQMKTNPSHSLQRVGLGNRRGMFVHAHVSVPSVVDHVFHLAERTMSLHSLTIVSITRLSFESAEKDRKKEDRARVVPVHRFRDFNSRGE